MARLKVTLVNNFHNTSCNVVININPKNGYFRFTESQSRKIENELCGNKNCLCGTARGNCFVEKTRESFNWEQITENGLMQEKKKFEENF